MDKDKGNKEDKKPENIGDSGEKSLNDRPVDPEAETETKKMHVKPKYLEELTKRVQMIIPQHITINRVFLHRRRLNHLESRVQRTIIRLNRRLHAINRYLYLLEMLYEEIVRLRPRSVTPETTWSSSSDDDTNDE